VHVPYVLRKKRQAAPYYQLTQYVRNREEKKISHREMEDMAADNIARQ